MAECDASYYCRICGEYVEDITESEIYLRFVLGEVAPERLFDEAEAHLACATELSQYIVDPGFPPVAEVRPEFDKRRLDPAQVAAREDKFTRAWRRLQRIPGSGWKLADYLLEDAIPTWLPGKSAQA